MPRFVLLSRGILICVHILQGNDEGRPAAVGKVPCRKIVELRQTATVLETVCLLLGAEGVLVRHNSVRA